MRETHGENISFTAWTNSGELYISAGIPLKYLFN
jgi:hypothetical protein